MTEKIDTQGMSGEAVKGCTDNVYPKDANGIPSIHHLILHPYLSLMIKKGQS